MFRVTLPQYWVVYMPLSNNHVCPRLTTEPLSIPFMIIMGFSCRLYKAIYFSFVRLSNYLKGILMPRNHSSEQLRQVSIITSLFLGLKEDLSVNLSVTKDRSSFLKCHISWCFLPSSSDSFQLCKVYFVSCRYSHLDILSNEDIIFRRPIILTSQRSLLGIVISFI